MTVPLRLAQAVHIGTQLMKSPLLYSLILESEDKKRMVAETVIYAALILSAVVSILAAAVQPVVLPSRIAAMTIEDRG